MMLTLSIVKGVSMVALIVAVSTPMIWMQIYRAARAIAHSVETTHQSSLLGGRHRSEVILQCCVVMGRACEGASVSARRRGILLSD